MVTSRRTGQPQHLNDHQSAPGTVSEERTPSRDEWWVVLAGGGVMRTPDGDLDMSEGDIVVAEPGTTYTVATTGDTPSVRILVTDTNAQ